MSLFLHPHVIRFCCCFVSRKFYYPKVIAEEDDIYLHWELHHVALLLLILYLTMFSINSFKLDYKRLEILQRTPQYHYSQTRCVIYTYAQSSYLGCFV